MKRMWIAGAAAVALALTGCAAKKDGCCAACGDAEKCDAPKAQTRVYKSYGEKMTLSDEKTVPLAKVMASPDQYRDRTVRVSGTVKEVCQHKGCWISMTDAAVREPVFVKFVCPIEGRLIPVDAVGKHVVVEGKLVFEEISEDEARHIAEESGKSEAEQRKIVGPQKRVRIASPAAQIAGA